MVIDTEKDKELLNKTMGMQKEVEETKESEQEDIEKPKESALTESGLRTLAIERGFAGGVTKIGMAIEAVSDNINYNTAVALNEMGLPVPEGVLKVMKDKVGKVDKELVHKGVEFNRKKQKEIDDVYLAYKDKLTVANKSELWILQNVLSDPIVMGQAIARKVSPVTDLAIDALDVKLEEEMMNPSPNYTQAFSEYGIGRLVLGSAGKVVGKAAKTTKGVVQDAVEKASKEKLDKLMQHDSSILDTFVPKLKNTIDENRVLDDVPVKSDNFKKIDVRQMINDEVNPLVKDGVKKNIEARHYQEIDKSLYDEDLEKPLKILNNNVNETSYKDAIKKSKDDYKAFEGNVKTIVKDYSYNKKIEEAVKSVDDKNIQYKKVVSKLQDDATKHKDKILQTSKTPFTKYTSILDVNAKFNKVKKDIADLSPIDYTNKDYGTYFSEFDAEGINEMSQTLVTDFSKNVADLMKPIVDEAGAFYNNSFKKGIKNKIGEQLNERAIGKIKPVISQNVYEMGRTIFAPYKRHYTRNYNFYVGNMEIKGKPVSLNKYIKHLNGKKNITRNKLSMRLLNNENISDDKFFNLAMQDVDRLYKIERNSGLLSTSLYEDVPVDDLSFANGLKNFQDNFGTKFDVDFSNKVGFKKYNEAITKIKKLKGLSKNEKEEMLDFLDNAVFTDNNIREFDKIGSKFTGLSKEETNLKIKEISKDFGLSENEVKTLYNKRKKVNREYKGVITPTKASKLNFVMRKDAIIGWGQKYFDFGEKQGFTYSGKENVKILDSEMDSFTKEVINKYYKGDSPILKSKDGATDKELAENFYQLMIGIKETRDSFKWVGKKRSLNSLLNQDEWGFTSELALNNFLKSNEKFVKSNTEMVNTILTTKNSQMASFKSFGTINKFKAASSIKYGVTTQLNYKDTVGMNTGAKKAKNTALEIIDLGVRKTLGITTKTKTMGTGVVRGLASGYVKFRRTLGGFEEFSSNPFLVASQQIRFAGYRNTVKGLTDSLINNKLTRTIDRKTGNFLKKSLQWDLGEIGEVNFAKNIREIDVPQEGFMKNTYDEINKGTSIGDRLSEKSFNNMHDNIIKVNLKNLYKTDYNDLKPDFKALLKRNGVNEKEYRQFASTCKTVFDKDLNMEELYNLEDLGTEFGGDNRIKQILNVYENYKDEMLQGGDADFWKKGGIMESISGTLRTFVRTNGVKYSTRAISKRTPEGILTLDFKPQNIQDLSGLADNISSLTLYGLSGAINNASKYFLVSGGLSLLAKGNIVDAWHFAWDNVKDELGYNENEDTKTNLKNGAKAILWEQGPTKQAQAGGLDLYRFWDGIRKGLYDIGTEKDYTKAGFENKLKAGSKFIGNKFVYPAGFAKQGYDVFRELNFKKYEMPSQEAYESTITDSSTRIGAMAILYNDEKNIPVTVKSTKDTSIMMLQQDKLAEQSAIDVMKTSPSSYNRIKDGSLKSKVEEFIENNPKKFTNDDEKNDFRANVAGAYYETNDTQDFLYEISTIDEDFKLDNDFKLQYEKYQDEDYKKLSVLFNKRIYDMSFQEYKEYMAKELDNKNVDNDLVKYQKENLRNLFR